MYLNENLFVVFTVLLNSLETAAFVPVSSASNSRGSDGFQAFVFGGQATTAEKYPYLASLRKPTDQTHFCTGALVTGTLVLTAAHCLEPNFNGYDKPFVDIGRTCTNCVSDAGVRRVSVLRSVKHPKWTGNLSESADLALLILSERVQGPFLRVLPQERPEDSFNDYKPFKFAGYGLVENGRLSEVLQETDLFYRTRSSCRNIYTYHNFVPGPSDTICAVGDGGSEVCQGDSGGPLILKGATPEQDLAVGILSGGGDGCGRVLELPALFSSLYQYQDDFLRFYIPVSGLSLSSSALPSKSQERSALASFSRQNLGISRIADWGLSNDFCAWTGITCDGNGHVQSVLSCLHIRASGCSYRIFVSYFILPKILVVLIVPQARFSSQACRWRTWHTSAGHSTSTVECALPY